MDENENGIRLDRVLHRRTPSIGRTEWQKRIRNGDVFVNGLPARPSRKCHEGDEITFGYLRRPEPEVNRNYGILMEDEHILVLDKPPNLPLHPSGSYFKNTLYFILKETYGEDFTVHYVHRLDRETSGVLLLAKSPKDSAILQKAFIGRTVRKEYLAIVEGRLEDYIDARGFLQSDETSPIRRKRKFVYAPDDYDSLKIPRNSESSRTEIYPLEYNEKSNISLVRALLHTGRTHQIRATLFSLGYPMVGDRIYGVDDTIYIRLLEDAETDLDRNRLRITRTALHSNLLEFPHPGTDELVTVKSPIPADMKTLMRQK